MRFVHSLLVLFTFSTGIAHAQNLSPILQASQTSGYTLPLHAFERHCTLSTDGVLEGVLNENRAHGSWAISIPFTRTLTSDELSNLKAKIQTAKAGVFSSLPAQCGSGSTSISARVDADTDSFTVIKAVDCQPKQINQSDVTRNLLAWLKTECKIDFVF